MGKARTDRDTGSVKPGSRLILALYLVRRTNFEVSMIEKILFAYTTDPFCGSLDTEPVSWFWFADPHFVVLS